MLLIDVLHIALESIFVTLAALGLEDNRKRSAVTCLTAVRIGPMNCITVVRDSVTWIQLNKLFTGGICRAIVGNSL
jgi:hypothetical protein